MWERNFSSNLNGTGKSQIYNIYFNRLWKGKNVFLSQDEGAGRNFIFSETFLDKMIIDLTVKI